MDFTHDEVGGHLAEEWELPDSLTSVIQNHHATDATDLVLPPALRLVASHRETAQELALETLVEDARSDYGIQPDWMLATVQRSEEQATELSKLLGGK